VEEEKPVKRKKGESEEMALKRQKVEEVEK
jgi:hypothetical protein